MKEKLIQGTMVGILKRYATKYGCNKANVQVILSLKDDIVEYLVCENYKPKESQTAGEILNIKSKMLDFMGLLTIVPDSIKKSLKENADSLKMNVSELSAMICYSRSSGGEEGVRIALYKDNKEYLKEVALKDMFSE